MGISDLYKKFLYHYQKHGLVYLILFGVKKIYNRYINIKEVMYIFDLDDWDGSPEYPERVHVEVFSDIRCIPRQDLEELYSIKNKEIIVSFFESFFNRGAELWLAKMDSRIVGLQWALVGGFKGFYSMPITARDVILLAAEVFPEYRGRGIVWAISRNIYAKLKERNYSRVFLKVHVTNTSSLKGVSRFNIKKIGIVRTINLCNRYITIWDKKSLFKG